MRVLQNKMPYPVGAVAFGAGRLVAGGSGGIDVWDLANGGSAHHHAYATPAVWGCAVDPEGRWFYYSDMITRFRVLPLNDAGPGHLPGGTHDQHVVSLAVSPDGGQLVVCRGDYNFGKRRVECWKVTTEAPWSLAWAVRAGILVEGRANVVDGHHNWASDSVTFSPDGREVGLTEGRGESGQVVIRDAATGWKLWEVPAPGVTAAYSIQFTRDGQRLVGLFEKGLELWDRRSGRKSATVKAPGRAYLRGLAVHPSGRFLATAGGDGVVRFWSPETLRELKSFKWGIGKLHSVAFSPNGELGAVGGDKGQVVVWDVDD
jgi:WD40 repeat protein